MPRIHKKLPLKRSEWSFGELVYWHLFEFGTRPDVDSSALAGRRWKLNTICERLDIDPRTLRNWIGDKHFPDSLADLERELFGDNPGWQLARLELAEALHKTRARKTEKAKRAPPPKSPPIPKTSEEAGASPQDKPAKEASAPAETGKVRKTEPENSEIADESTAAPSDEQGPGADDSSTEDAENFWKSAPESSEATEDFPADHHPGEQDDTTQSHEDEIPEPAQSGRNVGGEDEEKSQGAVPDILRTPRFDRRRSRIVTALIATSTVLLIGSYVAVKLPYWFAPQKVATQPPPPVPEKPGKVPGDHGTPKPDPQLPPTPETSGKPEKPQPGPQDSSQTPPKPADQPQQTKRPPTTQHDPVDKEPTKEELALIEKRKAAQAEEMKKRIAEATQLDNEGSAGAKARAQRERERNANEVAGLGYHLFEYASVRGTSLGQVQTETVYDCAKSCHDIHCDAFAWYRDERPAGPRTCSRYKAPFTLEENTGYTAGKKVSALQGVKLSAAGGAAVEFLAQSNPSEPKDDGVVHCPNGPVKVTGFDLTCDAMLVGGTTLGSHRLSWTVKNINECARKCQPIKNCVGFTYNAAQQGGHSCVLFGPTPEKREDVPGWISGERPAQ